MVHLINLKNGDIFADSYSTLNRWKQGFSKLLNINATDNIRGPEMYTVFMNLRFPLRN